MTEPTRLLDDPSFAESLRADLLHAQSAGLQGFDVAQGAAGLKAALAAEAATTAAVPTVAAAGASKGVLAGLFAVALAGGAGWWATRTAEPPATAAPPVAAAPPTGTAARAHEPVVDTPKVPATEVEVSAPTPTPTPTPTDASPEPLPVAAPISEAPAEAAKRPRKSHRADAKPDRAEDYVREARLIADARREMQTRPKAALALLDQAKDEFPRGLLREEREALRVLTLHAMGRDTQARASAKRFLKRHGQGPYAEAVQQVLE